MHAYLITNSPTKLVNLKKKIHQGIHLDMLLAIKERFKWQNYLKNEKKWDVGMENDYEFKKSSQVKEADVKNILNTAEWYPWQKEIVEKLKAEPDDRTIMWVYEDDGNNGKTSLIKWIRCNMDGAKLLGGRCSDMKYAARIKPKIGLINLSRRKQNNMSYDGAEEVKDGLFFCPKYESDDVVMNCPHMLICANAPPKWEELSKDRWEVYKIVNKKLKRKRYPYADWTVNKRQKIDE